ncbi:MAG TPA: 50S ribosomal protein L10 [Candidatus Latescibacteria bacterium]|nr:50S ribosomal protein L10 [Gemmatimonadota bacterium]HCR18923.1 50S ribosomal protein L10 [Candidatus Latescibacterota bacterium]|tara:strand:- start:1308 stop:1862 length:555 start_codon:yes stop_codon:yes gene_type:complete
MPTADKIAAVEDLTELMKKSQGIYLTDFTGIDVPTFTQLRRKLREEDVSYRVVKNRLALRAAKEAGLEGLDQMFEGPTGLVSSKDDPIAPVRILTDFAKENDDRPLIKVGFLEGQVYVDDKLSTLAKLPPREVLLGQVVSMMQAPISGLALCLNGMLQNLVLVLSAVAEKKGESGGEEAPAESS